jgi:4-hydroxy-tetrahydrodipicolinate synthase
MAVGPTFEPSAYCCTVTPFAPDGSLDIEAVQLLIGRLGEGGVGAFIGTSSPGEGFSLSLAETEQFYGAAKEAMGGKKQVRAMGVEPHSADESWELIKIAQSVGLDAMQLYSLDLSHGNKPTMPELERFFRTNLERMTIPAVISSHFMLGYAVPEDVIERLLADYPHLIGFNMTTQDMGYLLRVVDLCKGRADVHVGGPQQALTVMAMGGQGFLCTEAILAPKLAGSVTALYAAGDYAAAADAYHRLLSISAVNRWAAGSIRFTKAALQALGLPGYTPRLPYLALDDAARGEIERGLAGLGIAELDGLLAARGGAA